MNNTKALLLVEYFVECGRMGDLNGLFVCTEEEMQQAIGKTVEWGEVLGKHSDIYHVLKPEHFTIKSNDQEFISKLVDLLGYSISGFNPIDKLSEDEEDEDVE